MLPLFITALSSILLGLGLVTSLFLLVMFVTYVKEGEEPEDTYNYVYTTIIVWTVAWAGFYYFSSTEKGQELPSYDYIIDLNQDHIDVYTDDGRVLEIHPDSLQSFIEKDNL